MRTEGSHCPPAPTPRGEIEALRQGGAEALDQFYRAHAPSVLGWCIRLGGPDLSPEPLARGIFAHVLRRLDRLDPRLPLPTQLFRIARKRIRIARWKARLRRLFGLSPASAPPADAAGAEAVVLHRRKRVQAVLERLPTAQREVVVLVDLESRASTEAAAMLRLRPIEVQARLHEARPRLARALEAEGLSQVDLRGREGHLVSLADSAPPSPGRDPLPARRAAAGTPTGRATKPAVELDRMPDEVRALGQGIYELGEARPRSTPQRSSRRQAGSRQSPSRQSAPPRRS